MKEGTMLQMLSPLSACLPYIDHFLNELQVWHVGHSLGGALATLAAYDMACLPEVRQAKLVLKCFAFGSPRTGNRAFAKALQVYSYALTNVGNLLSTFLPTVLL